MLDRWLLLAPPTAACAGSVGGLHMTHSPDHRSLHRRLIDQVRAGEQGRLQRQLAENAQIAAEVWTSPTVAEEFGLDLPLAAWAEWRQGNADATD
jgi:hypothetical protein